MMVCRIEECEICYGNLDITRGPLERRPIGESVVCEPKGIRCVITGRRCFSGLKRTWP